MKKPVTSKIYNSSPDIWRTAIRQNNVAEIQRLIESKCVDLKEEYYFGKEMLLLAKANGHSEIVRILEEACAKE